MFQAHGTRKRRRRSAVDQGSILSNDNTVLVDLLLNPQSGPSQPKGILEGVVACLSGLTPDEKDRYHNLITSLGGRYVVADRVFTTLACIFYHSSSMISLAAVHVFADDTSHQLHSRLQSAAQYPLDIQ